MSRPTAAIISSVFSRLSSSVASITTWAAVATFWPRVDGGGHLARDTAAAIGRAGFTIERSECFAFAPGAPIPPIPHIPGVAKAVVDLVR